MGGEPVSFRKGQHVKELTKKVGQPPREGTVLNVRGDAIEVRWDDGHMSILSGGVLVPAPKKKKKSS